jgi:glutathionyl-hydroquinone reductase
MGLLVDGKWHDRWYDTDESGGRFVRQAAKFHDWIRADGSSPFSPEAGRYHLYVSLACPWAHRTLIVRALTGLEEAIEISVVHPDMLENGWVLEGDFPGTTGDGLGHARFLYEIYLKARPDYTGRVTVPVLWDRSTSTIVNNESSEIIRMLSSELAGLARHPYDFYPEPLRQEIDAVNARVYETVNNGVYRCGFATEQAAYEEAFDELFATLDWLEARLEKQRYLVGNRLTEADVRLFTTLVRFDSVYFGHFKCNARRLVDYPNLWSYTRDLYQRPAIGRTVDFDHIKRHYHYSHATINPHRIVPKGPFLDFSRPHDRDGLA